MADFFYKSSAPAVVAVVREFYAQKDVFNAQLTQLGKRLGAKVASMYDVTSHYAGGVRLTADSHLDVHWRRPDGYGYRSLKAAAKPAKGVTKDDRVAIRAEHERLVTLWKEHCPKRLSTHDYWDRLNVNTGNLMWQGGIKFELHGTAYFNLGFRINEAENLANIAKQKPSSGWIESAVEILASEYEIARKAKLGALEAIHA